MAKKRRISEIMKQLGHENSKLIISFLMDYDGVERKAQSSVEDDLADKIVAHFSGKGSGDKKPAGAVKPEAEKSEPKKAPEKKENFENRASEKKGAPEGRAPEKRDVPDRKAAPAGDRGPDKKDKKPVHTNKKPGAPEKSQGVFISVNSGGGKKDGRGNIIINNKGMKRPVTPAPKPKVDMKSAFADALGEKKPAPKAAPTPAPAPRPEKAQDNVKPAAPAKPVANEEPAAVRKEDTINRAKETKATTPPVVVGPKILRHEEIVTTPAKNPRDRRPEGGRGRRDFSDRSQGAGRDGNRKEGASKGGNIFTSGSVSGRNFNDRPQGQRGDRGKNPGSKGGPSVFVSGPATKGPGRGKDKRKDDRRKDIEREDVQIRTKKFNPHGFNKPEKVEKEEEKIKVITLPEKITIRELAERMKIQAAQIVKKLFLEGKMVTVNTEISYEEAENIAIEYEIICEQEEKVDVIAELLKEEEEDESRMVRRPPVVCVMGHVDHGKTSLLDAIRKTNVTVREAGGITQHIGAYTVNLDGNAITFLDTPGHEAFTAMRMRGANSTDIAILVVAADDGVMPQTVEAINHAKAAGIEIIVAVNKIDKPNANIDRVKQELSEHQLIPEDWGGSTVFAPVSAKTGQGIPELLEMVTLTADILELKADPKRKARGLVIEAQLDKGRGPVATVLVQKGTLRVGDFIAAGACHGKVRAMVDDKGEKVKEAGPSIPVEILGLNDVPNAGEVFISPANDKEAKHFADTFIEQNRLKLLEDTKQRMSLDDVFSQIQEGNLKELDIIVKADVQGSVEAVSNSLLKLSNDEVVVKVIHSGVGAINESDVILASASNAIIIGFNVRPDATAKNTAETEGVDVRLYKVIYQAIEDVEAAMKGMLDPIFEERVIGHAEVRQIFKASGVGNIAGAYVLDGVFERGCKVRISREGEQLFEGDLASLKRFKDDVKEVKAGFECGLVFDGWDAMEELDIVEAYKMVEVPR